MRKSIKEGVCGTSMRDEGMSNGLRRITASPQCHPYRISVAWQQQSLEALDGLLAKKCLPAVSVDGHSCVAVLGQRDEEV